MILNYILGNAFNEDIISRALGNNAIRLLAVCCLFCICRAYCSMLVLMCIMIMTFVIMSFMVMPLVIVCFSVSRRAICMFFMLMICMVVIMVVVIMRMVVTFVVMLMLMIIMTDAMHVPNTLQVAKNQIINNRSGCF